MFNPTISNRSSLEACLYFLPLISQGFSYPYPYKFEDFKSEPCANGLICRSPVRHRKVTGLQLKGMFLLLFPYLHVVSFQVVKKYLKNFTDMKDCNYQDVPSINIMMVGATGSGKSSVLNTFVTAVTSSDRVKQPSSMNKSVNHKV